MHIKSHPAMLFLSVLTLTLCGLSGGGGGKNLHGRLFNYVIYIIDQVNFLIPLPQGGHEKIRY